jgi:hypothetical protein
MANPNTPFEQFRTTWRTFLQDPKWIAYVRDKLPMDDSTLIEFAQEPSVLAPFLYDAIMSLGMAMCQATTNANATGTADEIMKEFQTLNFTGASGPIEVHPKTGTRLSNDFVVWNLRESKLEPDKNAMYPSLIYQMESWKVVGNNTFVFANSYTTSPSSLPPLDKDYGHIGTPSRVVTLVPMGLIMICCLISLFWVYWYRHERAVRSAQPLFLSMISLGSFVMVSTIIPLGIDDGVVQDEQGLDWACQAVPWLYFLGSCCCYSALTAKTRGVYQVSHHRYHRGISSENGVLLPSSFFSFAFPL